MTQSQQCMALTKTGERCRNMAREGELTCYVHRNVAVEPQPEVATAPIDRTQLQSVLADLNALATELRQRVPSYTAPPISAEGLINLVRENLDRFTPAGRLAILGELREGLQGSSPKDFLDLDTWRGLWMMLNYTVQAEAGTLREGVVQRLSALPGASTLAMLQASFSGTSLRDFLELDTWRGLWFVLSDSFQMLSDNVKARIFGAPADD